MRTVAVALFALLVAACASAPPPMPPPAPLFHDAAFAAPSVGIDPAAALAISDEMRHYLAAMASKGARVGDRRQQLIEALYRKGELRLEYDAAITRTAAQAFEARSGNCLALVLMTAAFAKELGLAVRFQEVLGEEVWDRSDDIVIGVGHVNLTLTDAAPQRAIGLALPDPMTIDFLPPPETGRAPRVRPIQERTVVAMYLNNRAVESLTHGRVDDAYWWARESIRQDPELMAAYVTLAVVYRNRHHSEWAEPALLRVSEREPGNTKALSNRVLVLRDLGRQAEAAALAQQLDRLDPHPPFSYFRQGQAALREHRFEAARDLFAKEVERAPYHHEFEFWLAIAYLELHDTRAATAHLTRAMEISTTRKDHDLYAAKLDRLKALAAAPQ